MNQNVKELAEFIFAKLLDYLLSRCTHPDNVVRADILEGGGGDYQVQWCLYCGAYKLKAETKYGWEEFRRPRPVWTRKGTINLKV